jgi:hypothetical protein
VPTQIVSSEEYFPTPQTAAQREVEARLKAKAEYERRGIGRSNRRYGYVVVGG